MRIPARLLLIGLLAFGLYFAPRLPARAQQPGTVNVRPRVTSTQPGLPEVKATADRSRVPAGDIVVFTLSPAWVVTDPRYRVTLLFGDKKQQVVRQAKISHPYPQAGTYTYSILVEAVKQATPAPTPGPAIPKVELIVTPSEAEVNQTVSFSARLSHRYPNIKYRFVFADGSDTGWQDEAKTTHSYRTPKAYQAYVDIGISSNGSTKQAGGSQREAIKVTESRIANATVRLSVNPPSVESARPVTFNAQTTPQSANARYRFDYGDQSPLTNWQTSSQATHRYKTAGKYTARVEVRGVNRSSQSTINDSATIEVTSSRDTKTTVDLKVSPSSVLVGIPVFFQVVPSANTSGARYRFNFGDGSPATSWSSSPFQTHLYSAAGRYAAFVELAASDNQSSRPSAVSEKKSVRVTRIDFTNNTNQNNNRNNNSNDNRNNNTGNANANSTPRANNNANGNVSGNANSNVNRGGGPANTNLNGNANANVAGNSNSIGSTNGNANANGSRNANSNLNSNNTGNTNANGSGSSPSESPSSSEIPSTSGTTDSSDWWKYLLVGAILLLAGYQVFSRLFPPRPTFVPKADLGDSNVGADSPLSINLQMDVDPNINGGEFKIDTQGNSLIKSKRTEP